MSGAADLYVGLGPIASWSVFAIVHLALGRAWVESVRLARTGRARALAKNWAITWAVVLVLLEFVTFRDFLRLAIFGRAFEAEVTNVVTTERRGNPRNLIQDSLDVRYREGRSVRDVRVRAPHPTAGALRDRLVYEITLGDLVDVRTRGVFSPAVVLRLDATGRFVTVRVAGGAIETIDLGTAAGRARLDSPERLGALRIPILVSGDVAVAGAHSALAPEPAIWLGLGAFVLSLSYVIHRFDMR